MFKSKGFVAAGVLLVALLVGGIGGTIAWAQAPTPSATAPAAQTGGKSLADLFRQALAQRLGTTTDKLQQALTDAQKDAAGQAVQQGLLTQAQADAMTQRMQNAGPGSFFGFMGPRGGIGGMNSMHTAVASAELDAAAKALGMSSADLTTALRGGKTLLDVAREKNVDVTKLRTAIADAEKAALDQAVKDGKLSQAQADTLKANIKPENVDLNRRGFGMSPRDGMRGMMGGLDGFGGPGANGFGGRRGQAPGWPGK